jgi:DNA/RNA endonuclease YhcR with UshA esterase domain
MQCIARIPALLIAALGLAAPAITPEEAARHIGKSGAVEGVAVQVTQSGGNVFVNLGGRYPDHVFTAFVARADVHSVGLEYLRSMEGRMVSVAGRITQVKGKPQIQITKRDQIIAVGVPTPR